ncbi:MAG: ribosome-associated translation inhibitor RaiA [Clostridia bacterium]|nr:ribosome-associated translation inhibitor RaiA [Clostridia bacterium]MBP5208102.1 ribosome-associated translation inhibitor RaiA [Clostridia bacterium]
MKILIVSKQTEVTDDLKVLFDKKLKKFDKFFGDKAEATATLKERKNNDKKVELTINVGGTLFRAEETAPSFQTALDSVMSSIERQIRKHKTRIQKRIRNNDFAKATADLPEAEEEKEFDIRVKEFDIKPMTAEEAILQMNLLDHSFFVFENEATGKINVVYKRESNSYGLIEPVK